MANEEIVDWEGARSDKWRRQRAGMEAMLAPVDQPLLHALNLDAPLRIADVGCGGGATTRELLRRAPPGSVAHGFDVSASLVESARRDTTSTDGSIAFEVADMGRAAPPNVPYDRLVSRFGVMFFEDAPSAFANLRRWLAPGGRFAWAVWASMADNRWMAITREVAGQVIDLPPVDASAPGPFRYADVASLLSLLRSAGFSELKAQEWQDVLPMGASVTADDAAQFALASFSSFAELLTVAGADALHHAQRTLASRFEPYELAGRVMLGARVHIVTGIADAAAR